MDKRIACIFVLCLLTLSAAGGAGAAMSIEGKIVNGTTGETVAGIDVTVINPTGGMKAVGTVEVVDGNFKVDGLDDTIPAYIVRLDYKGVRYDHMVRITGGPPAKQTVYVYEKTAEWDDVSVSVPISVVSGHGDHLQFERIFEINNKTDPPVTVTGEDGYFKFVMPESNFTFQALFVYVLGVPIEHEPVAAGRPGVYRAEYPIRPGVTRIGLSYTVPYAGAHYALSEEILYDMDKFVIASDDPRISITSETNTLVEMHDPQRPVSFIVENLKAGGELHVHFSGGGGEPAGRADQPSIIIIPNKTGPVSLEVMAVLLGALLLLFVLAAREPRNIDGQKQFYEQARDALLNKLARLDDLYKTGAVAAGAYYAKRAELKNQAAAAVLRAGKGKKTVHAGKRKTKERRK